MTSCQSDKAPSEKVEITIPQELANEGSDDVGAELADLFADFCLKRFPSETALAEGVELKQLRALSPRGVRRFLHDDPGRGWLLETPSDAYVITIEDPPYHACAVRRMYSTTPKFRLAYKLMVKLWAANEGIGPLQGMPIRRQMVSGGGIATMDMDFVPDVGGNVKRGFMAIVTDYPNGQSEIRLVHQIPKILPPAK